MARFLLPRRALVSAGSARCTLGGFCYRFAGRTVAIDGGTPLDEHGLPIHGLLRAIQGWSLTGYGADGEAAWVCAELDVGLRSEVLSAFPLPDSVEVEATPGGAR